MIWNFVILFLSFKFMGIWSTNVEYHILLHKTLFSLESMLKYYAKNLNNFNLDGIFGLSVVKGEVSTIINGSLYLEKSFQFATEIDTYVGVKENPYDRLILIYKMASILLADGAKSLRETNPSTYMKMKNIIEHEWRPSMYSRSVEYELYSNNVNISNPFNETFSDHCLAEILNYMSINNYNRLMKECNISQECQNVFLNNRIYNSYWITHQLLYTIIIEMSSCLSSVEKLLQVNDSSISQMQRNLCSYIYRERNAFIKIEKGTYSVSVNNQDLFLEQTFLCGTIGFSEFLSVNFLRMIIGWISPTGCFKNYVKERKNNYSLRKLLFEKIMSDNCLSHKTSLGIAVLSTYLKLFFDKDMVSSQTHQSNIAKLLLQERYDFQKRLLPVVDDAVEIPSIDSIVKNSFSKLSGNLSLWEPYYQKLNNDSRTDDVEIYENELSHSLETHSFNFKSIFFSLNFIYLIFFSTFIFFMIIIFKRVLRFYWIKSIVCNKYVLS